MIKKYIIASICVLAYFHLLPLLLEKGPVNSAVWDFLGLVLGIPYIPSGFIAMVIVSGGLHSAEEPAFRTAQILISDFLYVGIVWSIFYFKRRNVAKSGK